MFVRSYFSRTNSVATFGGLKNIIEIKVSPNPVMDNFTIHLPDPLTNPSELSLLDAGGKLVKQLNFFMGQTIQVGELPFGVYSLKLTTKDRVYVARFVKQ